MNLKIHIKIAFGYFFIVALLGVYLRLFHVADISFNYKNILHAHSHVALLGWVYIAITTLIYKAFLSNKNIEKKYTRLFWFTQISVIGMLLSFPFVGYALFSIVFSTLFLFASYFFVFLFLKHTSTAQKKTNSYKLIRTSLWLMVLSSLGPWVLGIIMTTLGNTSPWYRNAIYFYLHFQFNGWFIVSLFGLLFYYFEKQSYIFPKAFFKQFYFLLISGVFLTFLLSILWMQPPTIFYVFAGLGGLFQIAAFSILLKQLYSTKTLVRNLFSSSEKALLNMIAFLFIIKLVLQFLVAFPSIASAVSGNIDLIIGYLHLIFLGIISISLFLFLKHATLISFSKYSYYLYLAAFFITEILIFYKGVLIWNNGILSDYYYPLLFIASTIFLVAISGFLFSKNKIK